MKQLAMIVLVGMLLLVTAAPLAAAPPVLADGEFTASVNFSTLTATPVGRNCRLEVNGTLVFSGTLEGATSGTTRGLVFAPCAAVLANPPGSFRDIFRFTSDSAFPFTGRVNGVPTTATIIYQGRTAVGGAIDGQVLLTGDVRGVLEVTATVAVGGQYRGRITH